MLLMISSRLIVPVIAAGALVGSLAPFGIPGLTKALHAAKASGLSAAAKVPRTRIGINLPYLRSYQTVTAFQNLAYGDVWKTDKWVGIPAEQQTADDGVLYTNPGSSINHQLSIPTSTPADTAITCTYQGSGKLGIHGYATLLSQKHGSVEFANRYDGARRNAFWLTLQDVSRGDPFSHLDCRQNSAAKTVFRPEFVKSIIGYPVIRYMDWQNANDNSPVTWATRHRQGDTRFNNDGVAIEDMMAFANLVKASPWFVMPWNADDAYVAGFAQYVARTLPADKSVYVEVGNEVWNAGFAVTKQAAQEGAQRKLGHTPKEAMLLRYAQQTIHDMTIWEAAFKGRKGLVRVISSQHFNPYNAGLLFAAPGLTDHVDALATAPYFGRTMGGPVKREDAISALAENLQQAESAGLANKAIAQKFGKRYIAYEGGQGLSLPAEVPVLVEIENSPEMYRLYKSYLQWWKTQIGDTICLYNSTSSPGGSGAWGLTVNETDGPEKSAKLRAVLEERSGAAN